MIFVKENEKGTTGSLSPGKIIAWFLGLVDIYVSFVYFGLAPSTVELTFWQWIAATFIFGVLSAGFYAGMAKGAFVGLANALTERIKK